MKKIIFTLFFTLFSIQICQASKISLLKNLMKSASDDLAAKSGLTKHIQKHWVEVVGKSSHTIFKVSQAEIKEATTKILSEQAEWTYRKVDDAIAAEMRKGNHNIKLTGSSPVNSTYLSKNITGEYDLVIERTMPHVIGTRGEKILAIVVDTTSGTVKTVYPRARLTDLNRYTSYGIGGAFFATSSSDLTSLMEDYEDYIYANCNCKKVEPQTYSVIEFFVDLLTPIGFGSSEGNAGEAEYLKYRDFMQYEFTRRIDKAYENCNADLIENGITNQSCAPFSDEELHAFYDEFETSISMALSIQE